MRLSVKVVAGAGRDSVERLPDGSYRVRVAAPREKGRANARLVEVLAEALGVRPRQVRIVAGERSARKVIEVAGEDRGRYVPRASARSAAQPRSSGGSGGSGSRS